MNDITLPERVVVHHRGWYDASINEPPRWPPPHAEYIRADIAAAQFAERDTRIAELEAAQQWVSVDERLPESGTFALMFVPEIPLMNQIFPTEIEYFIMQTEGIALGEWPELEADMGITVTHWMPLPPPPVTDVTP